MLKKYTFTAKYNKQVHKTVVKAPDTVVKSKPPLAPSTSLYPDIVVEEESPSRRAPVRDFNKMMTMSSKLKVVELPKIEKKRPSS